MFNNDDKKKKRPLKTKDGNPDDAIALRMSDFDEKITPKKVSPEDLFLFQCPKEIEEGKDKKKCGNIHYRHAGYVMALIPYVNPKKEKNVAKSSDSVMICTKCKSCYVWIDNQMYDISHLIDLQAWEELEKKAYKATGPGGDC